MAFEDNRPEAVLGNVELKFSQPNVTVSTSARFKTHEVIGAISVRQKLGEDPDQISFEGICTRDEANDIDKLKEQEEIDVISHRWSGRAQVSSTSTRPVTDGGGQDKDEEFLHRFTVELVAVSEGQGGSETGTVGEIDEFLNLQ